MTKKVTTDSYRKDPLYPRVTKAVAAVLAAGNVVSPVDVLIRMDLLKPEQLKDWRHGRIPYLERVILGNLSRLSRLLRILRLHALDRGLKPSVTVYMKWGKGAKHRLRFTKTGDPHLEEAYSQHFVRPRSGPSDPPNARSSERKVDAAGGSNPVAEQPGGAPPTPADDRTGPLTTDVGLTGSSRTRQSSP